ncbi:polysaccharide deacetylase family protein [Microbulbifer sp. S227A]|uniref:polysaccharide deacetylase family protein n=1 Tax=Microbulbifer sp. S227A TaxID=3415131 RepID=UPI003C7BC17E
MTLDRSYMQYPNRKRGQDHDLYAPSYLPDRPPVTWPNGARVAIWLVPILEFFPFNMDPKPEPLMPPGGLARLYPDYWNYTLADYGIRVGMYRLIRAIRERGMTATTAVSARLAELCPTVIRDCQAAGFEIAAHGRDMGHLHGDHLSETEERALITGARDALATVLGAAPGGWYAPAGALSRNTSRLVAEAGFAYTCDWVSDELPVPMTGDAQGMHAMPLGFELSDQRLIEEYKRPAWDYAEQVIDAFEYLHDEAGRAGGRLLALPLHPRLIGAPHRISSLEQVLDHIQSRGDTWCATGQQILDHWKGQQ